MHLGEHIRNPFCELIEESRLRLPEDAPAARAIVASVWQCTDTLPGEFCADLDIPQGSSYAQAAQGIMREWKWRRRQAMAAGGRRDGDALMTPAGVRPA